MEQLETKITSQIARAPVAAKKVAPAPLPVPAGNKAMSREIDTLTQKLNGAARDVVEVLDGLPPDLEKRFNKADKDVYIQRLHEARGKRLLKTVGTRYAEDRSVRTRVDSYIRLFERLLDAVSEAPKGSQMVEACLASESGKVYMMLAEASGRIDAN
jgi:thioredoxin-like negative regulator of GroEL